MRKEVIGIVLCMALSFVGTAALRIQFPAVSFFARYSLRSTALDIGLLTASLLGARAVASIAAGAIYSRRSVARVLPPLCFLLNGGVAYLYPFAKSVEHIMCLRAIQGFLNGLAWVTIQVALGELSPPGLRATMYVAYFSIGSLGISAANYLYSYIDRTSLNPYVTSMHVSMALFIASAALAAAIPMPSAPRGSNKGSKRVSGRKRRVMSVEMAMVAALAASISVAMAMPSSDVVYIYVKETMGLSKSDVTKLLAEAMIVATGLGLALSLIADRLSEPAALRAVAGLAIVACFAMPLASPLAFAAAIILLVSLARSARSIARRIAIARVGPMGIGIVNAANNVGAVAGSVIAGTLYDVLGHRYVELGVKMNAAMATLYIPTAIAIALSSLALAKKRS